MELLSIIKFAIILFLLLLAVIVIISILFLRFKEPEEKVTYSEKYCKYNHNINQRVNSHPTRYHLPNSPRKNLHKHNSINQPLPQIDHMSSYHNHHYPNRNLIQPNAVINYTKQYQVRNVATIHNNHNDTPRPIY